MTAREKSVRGCSLLAIACIAGTLAGCGAGEVATPPPSACANVQGMYVTTITDIEGVFASRGVLTFSSDGALFVSDSRQGGQPGLFDPFTTGQGVWTCDINQEGEAQVRAGALTFTAASVNARATIGRVDYAAALDSTSDELSGTIDLRLAPDEDLESVDPVNKPGPVFESFGFVGERVRVPQKSADAGD